MSTLTPEISAKLKAPLSNVSWRVQSKSKTDKTSARVVAYIDARDVMDLLDDVVGPGNWSFDWTPITIENGQVMTAKGTLTVCGVTRSDIGEAGDIEKSKASVSDSLKRSAVHFGIGRYLYDLGAQYAKIDDYGNILPAELNRLNKLLAARIANKSIATQEPEPEQTPKPPAKINDEVMRIRAAAKEDAAKIGIVWSTIAKMANAEKYQMNLDTVDGINKAREWLKNPGMAVGIWRWQCGISEQQYLAYKKKNNRTDEQVYADLQVSAEQRGDIMAAMKEVAA